MRTTSLLFVLSALFTLGCSHSHVSKGSSGALADSEAATTVIGPDKAQAILKSSSKATRLKGMIHFTRQGDDLKIETMVDGLPPGPHGFHIHETGDCSKFDFSSAGGHFNPTGTPHGSMNSPRRHAGDLGNLMADNKGKAYASMLVKGLQLEEGPQGIIGKSVIIHLEADDLKSQPAGNSGARIACGVIEAL